MLHPGLGSAGRQPEAIRLLVVLEDLRRLPGKEARGKPAVYRYYGMAAGSQANR